MTKSPLQKNSIYILFGLIGGFFISIYSSIRLFIWSILGKNPPPLKENLFLDAMNFCFHIGPKSFWKAPSGIKIWRSLSTFLHYVFKKDEHFKEKLKNNR